MCVGNWARRPERVYLGFDPQLQREIAIKTVHFSKPDLAQNKVLLDEARTVSKLRHPNIVPIFEAGEEGGDLYLVFEYVPGKNLGEFLRQSGALSHRSRRPPFCGPFLMPSPMLMRRHHSPRPETVECSAR
jgi:serine/threonine protein kinase